MQVRKLGGVHASRTFASKSDAFRWATFTEADIGRGVFVDRLPAERTTVRELLDRYENEVLANLRSKAGCYMNRLRTTFGPLPAARLTVQQITAYRDKRITEASAQAVRHEIGLLTRTLKRAHTEWGITLPAGVPSIRKPKLPPGRDRRLLAQEEERLVAAMESTNARVAFILALETAMRRGELAAMRWEHVRLKERLLNIPVTKTDTARTIPLSLRATDLLSQMPIRDEGSILDLEPHSITQAFGRACNRAKIDGLRFHDLRHEATSRLFEKGLGIMEVALVTGHKSLSMLKRYTHLRPESLLAKLDGQIQSPRTIGSSAGTQG